MEPTTITLQREVIAQAMTRLEYNTFRGWTLPNDENGADEGYKLTTIDGSHISWSPKSVVDKEAKAGLVTSFKNFAKSRETLPAGFRLIGGIPLIVLFTLDGDSGIDLLDATINWVQSLAVLG